jgi:hypothetical protein
VAAVLIAALAPPLAKKILGMAGLDLKERDRVLAL